MKKSKAYLLIAAFAVMLAAVGLVIGDASTLMSGLLKIWTSTSGLIVDYVEFAGPAAAFTNAALVVLVSDLYLWGANAAINGMAIGTIGIMAGFSLFGKNVFNMLPILVGGILYTMIKKSNPADSCCISLMASCLGPVVSFVAFGTSYGTNIVTLLVAFVIGIALGVIMPYFAAHTAVFQHGMNLYNTGFTCGFLALFCNALFSALKQNSTITSIWGSAYDKQLLIVCVAFAAFLILAGLFLCGSKPKEALQAYKSILNRPADDYFTKDGAAGTFINAGINGLMVCLILSAIGGNFNGPTLAGVFSVMGFSAKGKNLMNTLPLYVGVLLAAVVLPSISINAASVQLAVLFITACAPLVSEFGWIAGILAGFFHCFLVQKTGGFTGGFNLYNNGFSAGLVCAALFPLLMAVREIKERRAAAAAPAESEIAAASETELSAPETAAADVLAEAPAPDAAPAEAELSDAEE